MKEKEIFYGRYETDMKLADLHVHTNRSDGIWSIKKYLYEAKKRGLSGIVFTDHDNIATGYEAMNICAKEGLDLEIIPCSEVSAKNAHIFAFDVEDNIPIYQNFIKTIDNILKHKGNVGFPHPAFVSTESVTFEQILWVARQGIRPAVEIFNAGVHDMRYITQFKRRPNSNEQAKEFYIKHKDILGPALAGTDAHGRTIGRALVAYHGSLREALATRQTNIIYINQGERLLPWDPLVHYIKLKQLEKRRVKMNKNFDEEVIYLAAN